jgi:hypothetical protein
MTALTRPVPDDPDCATGARRRHNRNSAYDSADRPTTGDTGSGQYTYDPLTARTPEHLAPATDAPNPGPDDLTLAYYDSDLPQAVTRAGITTSYALNVDDRRTVAITGRRQEVSIRRKRHPVGSSTQPVHKKTVDGTQSSLPSTTLREQYQRFTPLSTITHDPGNDLVMSCSTCRTRAEAVRGCRCRPPPSRGLRQCGVRAQSTPGHPEEQQPRPHRADVDGGSRGAVQRRDRGGIQRVAALAGKCCGGFGPAFLSKFLYFVIWKMDVPGPKPLILDARVAASIRLIAEPVTPGRPSTRTWHRGYGRPATGGLIGTANTSIWCTASPRCSPATYRVGPTSWNSPSLTGDSARRASGI